MKLLMLSFAEAPAGCILVEAQHHDRPSDNAAKIGRNSDRRHRSSGAVRGSEGRNGWLRGTFAKVLVCGHGMIGSLTRQRYTGSQT